VLAQGDAPILPEFFTNSDDLSLSFEVGAGVHREAPRLTDVEDYVQPPQAPTRRDEAADLAQVNKALTDADTAVNRGDLARAIQFYTDALDIGPGNVEAHIGRGRCYLELGDYSSAMSDFQRAEDLSPDDPESHLAMGDLYYNRKEYKRAIDFYDEAVELDGQHAMAKCKRGLAHYYRKNYRQAFQDLQRAMALDPAIPNIHKYVQMALKKMDAKA
jgi:tetratricopeptide (TPR) repeat protein